MAEGKSWASRVFLDVLGVGLDGSGIIGRLRLAPSELVESLGLQIVGETAVAEFCVERRSLRIFFLLEERFGLEKARLRTLQRIGGSLQEIISFLDEFWIIQLIQAQQAMKACLC